ncbi:hypothetical protein ACVGWK_01085, partial [Enterobacter sichuanensis]
GVETFFGHQVALGAWGAAGGHPLDDLHLLCASTPPSPFGVNHSHSNKKSNANNHFKGLFFIKKKKNTTI